MFGNKKEAPVRPLETRIRTIGLAGCGRGVGTSHLAISLANYLTGVKRKKTALLECSSHDDFSALEQFAGFGEMVSGKRQTDPDRGQTGQKRFCIMEVDYYKMADPAVLSFCLGQNYRYIIMDYGEVNRNSLCECTRCDRKILVGSLCEWKAGTFLEILEQAADMDKSWRIAVVSGAENTRKQIERLFRCSLQRIPASTDAFCITREEMSCYEALLF